MSKRKRAKRSWRNEVGQILAGIFKDHANEEMTLTDVYRYAIKSGKIPPEYLEGVAEQAHKAAFASILRSAKLQTSDGEDVRRFQSYCIFVQTQEGEEKQLYLWRDMHQMSRSQMSLAAMARIRQSQDIQVSVKADVRYWDENVRKSGEKRLLPTIFDD